MAERPTTRLVPTSTSEDSGPDSRQRRLSAGPKGPTEQTLRLRIDLRYDGSQFRGWARQPGQRTVQQVVEDALSEVLGTAERASITVAGRTDAGVHARGQVAHADVPASNWAKASESALPRLDRRLPPDVMVSSIGPAPTGFDARFSALWRRYSYRVSDGERSADPLRRHDTLRHGHPLDLDRMNQAGRACLGEHDFAAYCRQRPGATTVRKLLRLDWRRTEAGAALGTVVADAFCHSMVRSLVGALLEVGDGRRPPDWPAAVLGARVRYGAVQVAPAYALCLEQVGYPVPGQLASRAEVTRRVRQLPEDGHTRSAAVVVIDPMASR